MPLTLRLATDADLAAIETLMNAAFRGKDGELGWSFESGYITGDRTTISLLKEEIGDGALFLLADGDQPSALKGCVSLHPVLPERWYLGSLTVGPAMQNKGFGRELLEAAEAYALEHGAGTMEMTVVNLRGALIAWYERRGYRLSGETRPFPYGDNRYGTPTRDDLHFVVLERVLRH